ncbi:MAG: FHA domain-containing protein, partial [Planctomycetes bacterium]|nr:FHA domain-containing protein [Planctomycetota bacterium]
MARLVIFDTTVRGVDLPPGPVILGRSKRADVPIRDEILSRKHCTIVPTASGWNLIDLNSSNGTYLNGLRVEKSELKPDDVIEIGNTVIVLLDTDSWRRGEGLTRLRNPLKAQELVQTLKRRAVVPGREVPGREKAAGAIPPGERRVRKPLPARERRRARAGARALEGLEGGDILSLPIARDVLEAYAFHRLVSHAARGSPRLRKLLERILERLATREAFGADLAGLRDLVRKVVGEEIARVVGV